jgi:two-component system chemotaxis response regulator CheB
MIRVLVAEDSPTARLLLVEILSSDPDIQVVGQARDGVEAVEMTRTLRPDLVTMDVHMPRLNGLDATREIMTTVPTPIVIVTSSAVAGDVERSMHALRAGALDVVPKPVGPHLPGFAEVAQRLIRTVKALSQVKVVRHWRAAQPTIAVPNSRPSRSPIVAIATSTGGPPALEQLLRGLPGDFAAPLLVVQHIAPGFVGGLASWLDAVSDLRVKIAEDGELLRPHRVYLAPDGRHLGVAAAGTVVLAEAAPVGGFRPSGTFLFESAAAAFGAAVVAVILTGMGDDGVAGLKAVRATGGRILAQDEASSIVFGMPGAAVAAGLPDQVLPLDALAPRLVQLVGSAERASR